jgi:hypothetical protein
MRCNWVAGVVWGAVGVCGCSASGVHFAGSRQAAVVSAAQVDSAEQAPGGLERLGKLSVECHPGDPAEQPDSLRLSDLSCSPSLLRAALREAAADAGGSFLTLPECRQQHKTAGGSSRVSRYSCDASVYGPADPKAFTAPAPQPLALNVDPQGAVAPGAPGLGSALQAWRIEIDFWAPPGSARSTPRDPDAIGEIDFPQVGQRRLGDLSARCDEGCSVESVRRGLRAAAAWLGGTTLVAARCIQTDAAVSCLGSVSAPELEEGRLAGAR